MVKYSSRKDLAFTPGQLNPSVQDGVLNIPIIYDLQSHAEVIFLSDSPLHIEYQTVICNINKKADIISYFVFSVVPMILL